MWPFFYPTKNGRKNSQVKGTQKIQAAFKEFHDQESFDIMELKDIINFTIEYYISCEKHMTNKSKWNGTAFSQGFAHSRDFIQIKQCIKK